MICGFNGGVTAQVFSPGSVIILQRQATALPEELLEEQEPGEGSGLGMPTMSMTVQTGDSGVLGGLRVTTFAEGVAFLQDQSATDREPAFDSTGT